MNANKIKTFLLIFLVLAIFIPMNPAQSSSGSSVANALPLPLNTIVNGTVSGSVWYNATIVTAGYYTFNLTTPDLFFLSVYNSQGINLGNGSQEGMYLYPQSLTLNLASGVYSVYLKDETGYGGSFSISVVPTIDGAIKPLAINLPINTIVSNSMSYTRWYKVDISSLAYYDINLNTNSTNFILKVYDNNGVMLGQTDGFSTSQLLTLNLTSGIYYLEISNEIGAGTFNLIVKQVPNIPGSRIFYAFDLSLNTSYYGNLPNDVWYNVSIKNAGTYVFDLSGYPADYKYVEVFNSSGFVLANKFTGYSYGIVNLYLDPGIYSMKIYDRSNGGFFDLEVNPAPQISGQFKNNTIQLPLNSVITGNLHISEWFSFHLPNSGKYTLTVNMSSGVTFNTYIINNVYSVLGSSSDSSLSAKYTVNLSPGSYLIEIFITKGTGSFSMSLNAYQPSASLSNSSTASSKTTPFSSINTIFLSFIVIGLISLQLRKKRLK